MTPTEAAALLACCASFDNRKPDADAAKAWAMVLNDLPFHACRDAIVAHYGATRAWLMPADIRGYVTAQRAKRIAEVVVQPPPEIDPDDTAAYTAWLADARRRVAAGLEPSRDGREEITGRQVPELAGRTVPARDRSGRRALYAAARAEGAARRPQDGPGATHSPPEHPEVPPRPRTVPRSLKRTNPLTTTEEQHDGRDEDRDVGSGAEPHDGHACEPLG